MIAALAWLYVALHLFMVEGWLAGLGLRLDVSAVACLLAGLFVRQGRLPLFLLCSALARSVFLAGDVALHFLILGIPAGVLVPLRRLFAGGNAVWQAACAIALVVVLPRLGSSLGAAFGQDVQTAPLPPGAVLLSGVVVPLLTLLLRKLPPLSQLAEAAR